MRVGRRSPRAGCRCPGGGAPRAARESRSGAPRRSLGRLRQSGLWSGRRVRTREHPSCLRRMVLRGYCGAMSGRVLAFEPPASRHGSFLALELLPGRVHGALIDPSGWFRSRRAVSCDPTAARHEIVAMIDRVTGELASGAVLGGCVLSAGGVLDTAAVRMVEVVDMPVLEGVAISDHLREVTTDREQIGRAHV